MLRDLYHKEYSVMEYDDQEIVFGASIRRQNEQITDFLSYKIYLEEYLEFDIRKFFGLSVVEFFDLTLFEKDIIIKQAMEHMKKLNAEMDKMKNQINDDSNGLDNLGLDMNNDY